LEWRYTMERFWKVLSLSLIVGIIAVVAVGMVFAQDDTPEPPSAGEGRGSWHWGQGHGHGKGFPGRDREEVKARLADALGMTVEEFEASIESGETLESLAEANGVSLEELRQVMDDLFDEGLAEAVEEGRLTQEQANQILEDRAAKRAVAEVFDRDVLHEAVAEALGLTVDEFEAAMASGERISTLAENADITLEELGDIMQVYKEEALAQALAAGQITQDQANEMLERMESGGGWRGGKFGGHRGPGCEDGGMFEGPEGGGFPGRGFGNGGGFGVFGSWGDA
jgi:hypothetical protein